MNPDPDYIYDCRHILLNKFDNFIYLDDDYTSKHNRIKICTMYTKCDPVELLYHLKEFMIKDLANIVFNYMCDTHTYNLNDVEERYSIRTHSKILRHLVSRKVFTFESKSRNVSYYSNPMAKYKILVTGNEYYAVY
jgi:hypothetical protein